MDSTACQLVGASNNFKGAVSRIMIASLKMRYARLRGGGDQEELADDPIGFFTVHIVVMTGTTISHDFGSDQRLTAPTTTICICQNPDQG